LPRITGKPLTYFFPNEITSPQERDNVMLDPLLQEFIAVWPSLELEHRQAFVLLAKKGVILKAKRQRGEE